MPILSLEAFVHLVRSNFENSLASVTKGTLQSVFRSVAELTLSLSRSYVHSPVGLSFNAGIVYLNLMIKNPISGAD